MKRFNEWLQRHRPCMPFFRRMAREGPVFYEHDGHLAKQRWAVDWGSLRPPKYSPEDWSQFGVGVVTKTDDAAYRLAHLTALSRLMDGGVKAFAPTAEQFAALANVSLTISPGDYRQPFDSFALVVPDGLDGLLLEEVGERPAFVFGMHDIERRVLILGLANLRYESSTATTWRVGETTPLEELFQKFDRQPSHVQCRRAFLNACLLLTQYGSRHVGYANPEYAAKLEASLKKKRLPDNIREANRTALKLIPDVYAFDQSVRLFDTESAHHTTDGGGASYEVKPHWRRGHWRNQGVGAGRTERRMVFVRPVMVNAHKFHGDQFDTRATYTTA